MVEFGRTGFRNSADRIPIGFLESRVVGGRWCFYLRLWGVREALVGHLRDELSVLAADEIEQYIGSCLRQPPSEDVKPSQFHLVFRVEDGRVRARCYQKDLERNSYSTGEWWKDKTRSVDEDLQSEPTILA